MKPPPDNPEFVVFTAAMRHIMTVPKTEIQKRDAEWGHKKRPKTSVSRVPAAKPKREG